MNAELQTSTMSDIREIPLDCIQPSSTDAQKHRRESFDKNKLIELSESIRTEGLVQPIVVRYKPGTPGLSREHGPFEIVAGERRFLAAGMAGLERILCSVRGLSDEQVVRVQLIENLQRADLHPMHEAESYEELKKQHGYEIERIASDVGKSIAYVYGRLKLLALSKACRKAFYAGEISASIAEKLARIPIEKLQDQALRDVVGKGPYGRGEPMSFREAQAHISSRYMLDLTTASFPTADPDLNNAGPCGTCPKRAGNQPELFGDVKKADTCTDPLCFAAKARAYGQRQAAAAKAEGRETITGKEAEEIARYGIGSSLQGGYYRLDEKIWTGQRDVKASSLLKEGEKPALLVDPKSGQAVEVVRRSQLAKPERASSMSSGDRAARKKAEIENKFRRALYEALRPKLQRPSDRELARAAYNALDSDLQKLVWRIRGVKLVKAKYGSFDGDAHLQMIEKLDGAELESFMNDCIYAPTLRTNTWTSEKTPARLLAAAKAIGVDATKIRASVTPVKKRPKTGVKVRKKAKK